MITTNILSLINKTPESILESIALRVKERRLEKNITQRTLASRAGISYASYRRFETTGEISFHSLVMIAIALDMTEDFDSLFTGKTYQSLDELLNTEKIKKRKRGSNNE